MRLNTLLTLSVLLIVSALGVHGCGSNDEVEVPLGTAVTGGQVESSPDTAGTDSTGPGRSYAAGSHPYANCGPPGLLGPGGIRCLVSGGHRTAR